MSAANIAAGYLVFTPDANANGVGYASFEFQVADSAHAFDPTARTMTVDVTPVNDAPHVTVPSAQTVNEDTALSISGLSVSDIDANGGTESVTLTVLHGTLTLGSTTGLTFAVGSGAGDVTMTFDGTIADLNTALAGLSYQGDLNYNGSDTLNVTISDNGHTGIGGAHSDSSTVAITVNPVNDAPTGADNTITISEDTSHTFSTSDFGFSDVDTGDSLSEVGFATLPLTGRLTLNGIDVTGGQVVSAANIAAGYLVFTPDANANGVGYASFEFQVADSAHAFDPTARTMTVDVTPVNDAPHVTVPSAQTVNEDTALSISGLSVSDIDANGGTESVTLTVLHGTLTLGSTTGLTFAVGSGAGDVTMTFDGTIADLNTALAGLSYQGDLNYNGSDTLNVTISDNGHTGIGGAHSDSSTVAITVNPVNDAPVVTAGGTLNYTENDAATVIDSTVTVGDVDNSSLASATVQITGNYVNGEDVLAFTDTANITGSFDASTGTLTLSGSDTVANYQAALRSVTYSDISDNPSGLARTVSFTANDGSADSAVATATVNITPVNDAPHVTVPGTQTANEDTALSISGLSVSDVDGGSGTESVTLDVSNGTLTLGSIAGLSFTTGTGAGDASMTFSGTIAELNTALASLSYQGGLNYNGSDTLNVTINDNGHTGISGAHTDSSTIAITVTPVNDAPAGADNTLTTLEDTPYTFSTTDFGFSDPSDSPANNLQAVEITTLPTAGTLTDNGVAVTAGQFVSAVDIAGGKLVFTPDANANGTGYASLTFQVQDDGGTANGGVDIDASPNTITFDVTPVNDAPAGADNTLTTLEDTPYTFSTTDFGFSDPSDSPANNLQAVEITTLPTAGTLTDNGVAVTAGQFVSAVDIAGGKLVFTPDANANGTGYASLTFQVQDDGGTANGGVDIDASPNTITFDVTPVNDAPAGADNTLTTLEDTPYTFSTTDFGFSDPSDSPANNLQAVEITTLPTAGTLTDNGVAVTAGQFVSAVDIAGGKLVFTPDANANGTGYASLTFQVQDDGGTANGGVDIDASPNTITFDVTPVNDAPAGADNTLTTLEDTPYTFSTTDFGFSDPSDSPANNLQAVEITTLPTAGTLTDNGVAVTAGQFVSAVDIAGGKLVFTPDANANGTGYASLTFQVQDDGGAANGGVDIDASPNTITFDVTPVNDAPAGADNTLTTLEDTPYTFSTTDFGFSDPSDSPANNLQAVEITTLPTAGTLTDNGIAVTAGQFVSAADIAGGKLVFTPDANANGTGYASLTFQVQDDGGTANGGVDIDASPNTITFDVTPVNDPAIISGTITGSVTEAGGIANGTPGTPTASGLLTDTDIDNPANTFTAVGTATTSDSGYGSYTMDAGGTWAFTVDNNNAAVQALNVGHALTDTFTVHTVDGTAQQVTITIHGANDTPTVATGNSVSFDANQAAPVTVAPNIQLADVDSGNLSGASVIVSGGNAFDHDVLAATTAGTGITATYDSNTGTLTLSGVDTVAHYQQVLASMTFSTDATNDFARTVSWSVTDDLGATSATATTNVSVAGRVPTTPPNSPTTTTGGSPGGTDTGGQQDNGGTGLVTDVHSNDQGPQTTGSGAFIFPSGDVTAENLPDGGVAFHVSLAALESSLKEGPYFIDMIQADGDGLPDWMKFDPNTGVLTVQPPDGTVASLAPPNAPNDVQPGSISTQKDKNGDVIVKVQVRDASGNVATLTFTVKVQHKHSELWPDRSIERQGWNSPAYNEHYVRLASLRDVAALSHRSVDFGGNGHDVARHGDDALVGTDGHIQGGRAGLSEQINDFGGRGRLAGRAALLDSLQQRAMQQRMQ